MLRVPSDPNKENIAVRRGCGCIADKGKQSRFTESARPKIPPAPKYGLKETTSKRTSACPCVLRVRAKSSTDGDYQPSASGAAVQSRKTGSYDYLAKKEIKEILKDKQPIQRNTDLNKCKGPKKPVVLIDSSNSFDIFNDENIAKNNVINSTKLTAPVKTQVRRYSCSSVTDSKKCNVNPQPVICKKEHCSKTHGDRRQGAQTRNGQYTTGTFQRVKQEWSGISPIPARPSTCKNEVRPNLFSPILQNHFTSRNTLINKRAERLREPKIKRRADTHYQSRNRAFVGDIYNEEYIEDIFQNIKKKEKEIVLKINFLKNYNPDYKFRAGVLNWLLKEQAHLNFSEGEYYLAVNFLDNVLAATYVPVNMYQLVVITSLWIAMKLCKTNVAWASELVNICERAYSTQQLLKMERKILKIMDFKVHTTEPSICVYYYLRLFRLQNHTLAKLSVYYILDCLSLTPEFSSTKITILVAASVKYTLTNYLEGVRDKINSYFKMVLRQEEIDMVNSVESYIYMQLVNMDDENYMFKEPRYKYSKTKRQ